MVAISKAIFGRISSAYKNQRVQTDAQVVENCYQKGSLFFYMALLLMCFSGDGQFKKEIFYLW
jgi:hypothetical protein